MRYIVFFLFIANLAYFGWRIYSPPEQLPALNAQPRPLLNQGLVLLREFEALAESESAAAANLETPAPLCYLVGDFPNLDDATSFQRMLESIGFVVERHLAGEPLDPRFRVYLPPASSRAVATITLDGLSERLASENLEIETYLITRGMLENAIALGVFADEANASRVQSQVSALGYNAEIEVIPRSSGPIQLVMAKADFTALDIAEWLEFAGDRLDLTYSENLCETIAQGPQFP